MKPIIDISYWQDPVLIDYDQLAGAVDGVILRAAYGIRKDTALDRHYAEFTKRGIPVGAYHFIVEYKPVSEQVVVFLNAVHGKNLKLGYWCDVEYENGADKLTAASVIGWMDGVEAKVGECGVYAANWCWRSIMQGEYARYKTRKLWCAAYTESIIIPPGWDGNWYLWQYTSSGRLPGYGGNLDMNKLNPDWKPAQESGGNLLLNIEPLAQRDPRWSFIKLGTSSSTIGGYGCLITSATMMLNHFGFNINPARLNELLIANGGYSNGNLFVWDSLRRFFPAVTFGYRYNSASLDKVDAQLAAGRPVIVNVDLNPATPALDEHWVLVVGKVDGSYIINDPWYGTQFKFEEKYGNPSTGMRIVCTYNFAGTVEPIPEPTPIEVGTQVKTLVNLNIRKGAGTGFERWATAPKGTVLDVLEIKGDWVRVGWNQWCMSKYNGVKYLEGTNGR